MKVSSSGYSTWRKRLHNPPSKRLPQLVKDSFIGWSLAMKMTAEPVISALQKAISKGLVKRGAIVHSD